MKQHSQWRIVESLAFKRGVFGIETLDTEAIENDEAAIVPPCLTRENAELIVRAHNAAVPEC